MGDSDIARSVAERRIAEAMERGEFDDLPGAGQPIPDLDLTHDPAWWAKKLLARERLRDAADDLRRRVRRELPGLRAARDEAGEAELRHDVSEMNKHLPEELHIRWPGDPK